MKIIKGNETGAIAARTRGWIVGYFMGDEIANTNGLETKLWRYDKQLDYGQKTFPGTELIVIYGGKLRLELENEAGEKDIVTLKGTEIEYVILPPNLTKKVIVEEYPAFGVTVRWPSV